MGLFITKFNLVIQFIKTFLIALQPGLRTKLEITLEHYCPYLSH